MYMYVYMNIGECMEARAFISIYKCWYYCKANVMESCIK